VRTDGVEDYDDDDDGHDSLEDTMLYVLQTQVGLAFFVLIVYLLIKYRDRFEWYRRRR